MTNYVESATIKNPEVGDVYGHTATCDAVKIHIYEHAYTERGQDFYSVIVDGINSTTVGWRVQILPEKTIKKYYTYLGKSKAKISDLFEVQDD